MPIRPPRASALPALTLLALTLPALALLALTPVAPATAQTPAPVPAAMVVEVPDPDQPDLLPGMTNRDLVGRRFAAFAAGALCAAVDVPADGGFSVVLGEAGQPADCRTPGAAVEFAGTTAGSLTYGTTFAPGSTVTLDNWAPSPPHLPLAGHVCAWLAGEGVPDHAGCLQIGPPSGEALWRFAPRSIFGDARVILSLAMQLDAEAVAGASSTPVVVAYGDPEVRAHMQGIPPDDAVILLQAAGVVDAEGRITGLREVRTCRVWAARPLLASVAQAVADEVTRILGGLGLSLSRCASTEVAAEADILVYDSESVPAVDSDAYTSEGSFLVPDQGVPQPPSQPGGAGGGPAPAPTGHGAVPDEASVGAWWLLAALAPALLLARRVVASPARGAPE